MTPLDRVNIGKSSGRFFRFTVQRPLWHSDRGGCRSYHARNNALEQNAGRPRRRLRRWNNSA